MEYRPGSKGFTEELCKKRIKALEQRAEDKNLSIEERRKAWDEAGRLKSH